MSKTLSKSGGHFEVVQYVGPEDALFPQRDRRRVTVHVFDQGTQEWKSVDLSYQHFTELVVQSTRSLLEA